MNNTPEYITQWWTTPQSTDKAKHTMTLIWKQIMADRRALRKSEKEQNEARTARNHGKK